MYTVDTVAGDDGDFLKLKNDLVQAFDAQIQLRQVFRSRVTTLVQKFDSPIALSVKTIVRCSGDPRVFSVCTKKRGKKERKSICIAPLYSIQS